MASKKFSINSLVDTIPEVIKTDVKLVEECFKDVTLQVRRTLPLDDAMKFVNDISATCIDEEEAAYMPELFDFAVRMFILKYYANVDLTKDVKKAYQILYSTTLFEQVYANINTVQSTNLLIAAEKRIDHWKNILASTLAGKVTKMMHRLEDVMTGSDKMMEAIDSSEFKEAVKRLTESGILKEDEYQDSISLYSSPTGAGAIAAIGELAETPTESESKIESGSPGDIVYMKKKK